MKCIACEHEIPKYETAYFTADEQGPICLVCREKRPRPSVLTEADGLIYGDREKTYGRPDKNLAVIAQLWNAYLSSKEGASLNAQDVCMLMVLLKAARQSNSYSRDTLIDICGYAALNERIENGN